MARIKNTTRYPFKGTPIGDDFLIGSDSENNGKTVNFRISDIVDLAVGGGTDTFATLNGNIITFPDGQTVDVTPVVDTDTDTFATLANTIITFADGQTIDVTQGNAVLNGNIITFGDGQTADITPVVDTDTDTFATFNGGTITFADGQMVTIPTASTDDQIASEVPLSPVAGLVANQLQAAVEELLSLIPDRTSDIINDGQNGANPFITSATLPSYTIDIQANILRLLSDTVPISTVDLSLYLDDTNLARLVSGTLDPNTGIATFTRDDATTFTVDMSSLTIQPYFSSLLVVTGINVGFGNLAAVLDPIIPTTLDPFYLTEVGGDPYLIYDQDQDLYTLDSNARGKLVFVGENNQIVVDALGFEEIASSTSRYKVFPIDFQNFTLGTEFIIGNSYNFNYFLTNSGASAGVGLTENLGVFNVQGQINSGEFVGWNLDGTGAFVVTDVGGSGISFQNQNLLLEGGDNTSLRSGNFNTYVSAGTEMHLGGDDSAPTGSMITASNTDILFKAQYIGDPVPMRIQPQNDSPTGQVGQVLTKIANDGTVGWQAVAGGTTPNLDAVLAEGGDITGNRFSTIAAASLWQISGTTGLQLLLDNDQDEIVFGNADNMEINPKIGGVLGLARNASTANIGNTTTTLNLQGATVRVTPEGGATTPAVGDVLTALDATGRLGWQTPSGGGLTETSGNLNATNVTLVDAGGGATYAAGLISGNWRKIGSMVMFSLNITQIIMTGVPTGNLQINVNTLPELFMTSNMGAVIRRVTGSSMVINDVKPILTTGVNPTILFTEIDQASGTGSNILQQAVTFPTTGNQGRIELDGFYIANL